MSLIIYECLYCGHQWSPKLKQYDWMTSSNSKGKCPKCSDHRVKQRQYDKVDYYPEETDKKRTF